MPVRPPSFRPAYQPTPQQRAREYNQQRGSPHKRGYTRAWNKTRLAFLAEHSLCVMCEQTGEITPATEVDHIVPHDGDMVLFWQPSNWQALCERCHARKTRAENARGRG